MKTLVSILVALGVLVGLTGCHSGTMRGVGSDVERLGDRMQR
jgi:predicted small secreted protein